MSLLAPLQTDEFIRDIWQQRCHVFRQALPYTDALIEGDELAALACDPQLESRIIFAETQASRWRVEHGPFTEDRFENLPDSHWTLMVQGVDRWLPELNELLDQFSFLPRWRLDDVLATYACDGGGVGPHFDYYDVFLIQAQGRRQWRIGQQCNETSELQANSDVKLLAQFDDVEEYTLEAGDMLYIPPGMAHWGTAIGDDCITLSVGFRAPSEADLYDELQLPTANTSEDKRYTDTPASIDTDPCCINTAAAALAAALLKGVSQVDAAKALAQHHTKPYNLSIIDADEDAPDETALAALTAQQDQLDINVDAACRCAYVLQGDEADLYLNGKGVRVSAEFAIGFCQGKVASGLIDEQRHRQPLLAWLKSGYIYL